MADVSVELLAETIGRPVEALLFQMKEAGLSHSKPSDIATDYDKQVLLSFLKKIHEEDIGPVKITLRRKSTSTLKTSNNYSRTPNIEVRRRKENEPAPASPPKIFISYSWDSQEHKDWVAKLASMLRSDGIDAILDQWHLHPGDPIIHFMESSIKNSNFVLIICTEKYKEKSDSKTGGAGYEDSIISSDMFSSSNHRKYIPILKGNNHETSMPTSLHSKKYIDLSNNDDFSYSYRDLLLTIFGKRPSPPPIGEAPSYIHF